MQNKIKVMIVDDSALVRQVVTQAISKDPSIEVIGTAQDPVYALAKMQANWPDVLVLDIEMPRMDGLTFLKKIMAEHPTPVIICSSLAERGAQVTMEALAVGAVNIITKPKIDLKAFLEDSANDILSAVKAAARTNIGALRRLTSTPTPIPSRARISADAMLPSSHFGAKMYGTTDKLVAIGTSTGGTQALEAVLTRLPAVCTGIVIVQHMPEKFTAMFAARLDSLCQLEIREGKDGDRVRPGLALIAPGGRHMMIKRSGAQYYVEVKDGPLVNRHKPSVDVLFRSVAQVAGKNALGIIMTGMGDDGARGLKEMSESGATTIAEDESTCVVFGMPKEAIKLGGADKVVPLDKIPQEIITYGT
ncbi:protein-glutamate methylesterase/protein-glutamine glutaminase [Quatrionicoccus australiensis]|uniref:protein-glutamate methylesterase/protein-glutamine glutaminase n=1 Tax=Quatrionicoccus australiensis TaxID=138118 RepID=UPI001CFB2E8A|nr:chemotaxis response regulator protein-glutamate methylesterase [Quatrionicoccus australiensis]MCB4361820.1 chemotaxis response regulator protein-glutamate methylesterase [Quatrionicoccus australiensis]